MMGRLALSLTIVALTAAPVDAEVSVEAGVPFTAHELTAALTVRGAATVDIAVRAVSLTAVELRTSAGSQRVDLGAASGPAAARLVALQVAPIALDAATHAPPVLVASTPAPAGAAGWTLGVAAGGGHGLATVDFGLTVLRADATWARGPWRWGGSIGWLHGVAKSPDLTDPATADLCVVRGVARLAAGRLEIAGGPEIVAYRVTAASPGLTTGAGGDVRVRLVEGARWRAIASVDIDAFRHRVVVERDGVPFAATPRVALTAALGLAWEGP